MESPKENWRSFTVYTIMVIWLVGCTTSYQSRYAINSIIGCCSNASNTRAYTPHIISYPSTLQAISIAKSFYQKDSSSNYHSYNSITKGIYIGCTYQVKCSDTLFYISWITRNDYMFLAKMNHIHAPYRPKIGQVLQVTNNINSESKVSSSAGTVVDITSQVLKNIKTVSPLTQLQGTAITSWRWPTDGKIIDKFSLEEGGNKGIDISGSRIQPIVAAYSGRVVYAGNALRGYGNLIIIKHNDDYLSAYAHNDTILVHEQEEVVGGQKIATMGSTGTVSVRLHFEIRYKGKSVNPLHYLPKR